MTKLQLNRARSSTSPATGRASASGLFDYSYYDLMTQLTTRGRKAFFKEKQNDPRHHESQLFDPETFRYFTLAATPIQNGSNSLRLEVAEAPHAVATEVRGGQPARKPPTGEQNRELPL